VVVDPEQLELKSEDLAKTLKSPDGKPRSRLLVYSSLETIKKHQAKLKACSEAFVVKDASGPGRLLDLTSVLLQRSWLRMPGPQKQRIHQLHHGILEGKEVLLVDDDIRNIFALSSLLERWKMKAHVAETGMDALRMIREHPGIEVVLMDIMLPGMDGFETIREVRKIEGKKNLPIVAVTAKAMKGDREKCFAAGASDYLAKPVKADQLAAILRLWLHK
jgi:CheY-like chemotaxis protein